VLGLAGWLLVGNLSISAAPITGSAHKSHPVSGQISAFEAFLKGGPAHWARNQLMEVPDGVHVRNKHGQLKDNLTIDYVMWVRDQHPLYFDRHHPRLGRQLAAAQADWGTSFLVFPTKHEKAAHAESIHAMTTTSTTSSSSTGSSSSTQAQVLDPPSTGQPKPTTVARSAIVDSAGTQLFPANSTPPSSVANLPAPVGYAPLFAQEISSSSVVTSNLQLGAQVVNPAPIPEPSSVLLAALLFGSAAGWKALHSRGLRRKRMTPDRVRG
jgi:hypothetical protein